MRNQSGCSSIWETNFDLLATTWLYNQPPPPALPPPPSSLDIVVLMGGGEANSLPQAESLFLSWENQPRGARPGGPWLSWAADASNGGPGFQELGVRGNPWEGGKPLCPGSLASLSQPCSDLERPPSPEMCGWGMERRPGPLHCLWLFPQNWGLGARNRERRSQGND